MKSVRYAIAAIVALAGICLLGLGASDAQAASCSGNVGSVISTYIHVDTVTGNCTINTSSANTYPAGTEAVVLISRFTGAVISNSDDFHPYDTCHHSISPSGNVINNGGFCNNNGQRGFQGGFTNGAAHTYTLSVAKAGEFGGQTLTIIVVFVYDAGANTVDVKSATVIFNALSNQQTAFTQLIINHQSYNMISGVGNNLDGLFNDNGIAPLVSMNGFSYQSYGAQKLRARRERQRRAADVARKPPLDILANHSRTRLDRDAGRYDISANLMAYGAEQRKPASVQAVSKLDGADQGDLYAADLGFVEESPLSPWNFWVRGSWTFYDDHEGSSFDGHMVDVVGGVDYRVNDDLIVGLLLGYGMADFDTLNAGVAGSFEADGIHIGAYMGKRLAPNLLFDALLAYTASDYDNRFGSVTGSFDAHRVTFAAHLKGDIDWGMVTVQPMIGLMVASERQEAYRDSGGFLQAAKNVVAGRLSIGPKFTFKPYEHGHGSMQLWFATKGEYDFSNQNIDATTSLPDISDAASARLQAGMKLTTHQGASLSLQGDLSGLGSGEYISYGASANVHFPF